MTFGFSSHRVSLFSQADPFSGDNDYPFEITIVYKQRGWNPAA